MSTDIRSRHDRTSRAGAGRAARLALTTLALAAACAACGGPGRAPEGPSGPGERVVTGDEIVIGEYSSLTGPEATFGQSTHEGIQLAVEELNAAGGVKGKRLRVVTEDDQSRPEEAATVVAKLINQDRVIALLGEVASSRTLAAAPKAQEAGIPLITPSSTNPKVTLVGDYIFRVCFIDEFQGKVMARFLRRSLGFSRAAVLRDIRNDYSVGLADFFTAEFQSLGGQIASDQSYSAGDADFKAQLTAIRAARPEVIFVPGYYTDVGQIAMQARDLGITAPLAGGDGWESPKLLEIGGGALEGAFYANHLFAEDPNPVVAAFVEKYRRKFGAVPDSMAALAYDATRLLADAMGRAPELKARQIRDALAQTRDFPGVCGSVSFDANRNPVKPAVILEVKGGALTLREIFPPF